MQSCMSVKVSFTIDTKLDFNRDFEEHDHGGITSK